jgi:hypothetical protein
MLRDQAARYSKCGSITCPTALVAESDSLTMLPVLAIDTGVRDGRIKPLDIGGLLLNRVIALIFAISSPSHPLVRIL